MPCPDYLAIMTDPGQTGLTAAAVAALTGSGAADRVRDDVTAVGVEAGASRVGNKNKFIIYNKL